MVGSNPSSFIKLMNLTLYSDYKNQLSFNSLEEQRSFFEGRPGKIYNFYTYLRKDNTIKIEANYEDIIKGNYNYLYLENPDFSYKYYMYFIKNIRYINENCTELDIECDVFQTWMFEKNIMPSFVEREHVNNDTIGLHTVPENLETGDYIVTYNYIVKDSIQDDTLVYVLGSTSNPTIDDAPDSVGDIYNGIYSGVRYYFTNNWAEMTQWVQRLTNKKPNSIVCLFLAPKWIIGTSAKSGAVPASERVASWGSFTTNKITSIDGYVPKNNKLFTHPYCFIQLSNLNGTSATFNYELFNNLQPTWSYIGALTPGCSTKLYPINYCKLTDNKALFELGITGGKYPQLNWATDQFINWLTQNGVNIASNFIGSAVNAGMGAYNSQQALMNQFNSLEKVGLSSGLLSAGSTALTLGLNVASAVQNIENHRMIAPQVQGNVNSGDVAASNDCIQFSIQNKTIKKEFAEIIDNYFSMFGYKVNVIKKPNEKGRRNWNYVKTIGINIKGGIPQNDLITLQNIYNNGVTIWHNYNNMFNYSLDNSII